MTFDEILDQALALLQRRERLTSRALQRQFNLDEAYLRRLQAATARGLTRFVWRQVELTALQQALERAGAGQGQVVALVGEAGMGKSRLVYECIQSHRMQGWLVLESSLVSYGKATAYLPGRDLLQAYCQIEEREESRPASSCLLLWRSTGPWT